MMNEDFVYGFGIDDSTIRAERKKARELRKTRWWQQKTADGICHYCQRKVPVKELTMDHIIPLSRGGQSTKGNLVPCCKECNTAKKNDLPPELEELQV
jgi:5-methylcytosine-specific restriction endonuclease McrA